MQDFIREQYKAAPRRTDSVLCGGNGNVLYYDWLLILLYRPCLHALCMGTGSPTTIFMDFHLEAQDAEHLTAQHTS